MLVKHWRLAGIALILAATQAAAQSPVEHYYPDFFADSRPETAMDMVSRLPGFVFDGGDGTRGLSGSSGNVLINGKRPTSKTDNLSAILSRIGAQEVDHIDVVHSGALGIDMQGKATVANIVRKQTPYSHLTAIASVDAFGTGRTIPGGALQFRRSKGEVSYDISVRRDSQYDGTMGPANITYYDAEGTANRVPQVRSGSGGSIVVNGGLTMPLGGGDLSANATIQQSGYDNGTSYNQETGRQRYQANANNQAGELGANYQRDVGPAVVDLALLQRLGKSSSRQVLDDDTADSSFASLRDTGESVSRLTTRYPLADGIVIEAGAEAAYNFLQGNSTLVEGDTVQAVPASNVKVSEKRSEFFVHAGWTITSDVTLDTDLRAELSAINVSGDAHQSHSYFYMKPRVAMSWALDPKTQLRLRAEHRVGQLSFNDFVTSASLTQDNVTAGNPDLRPDQSWQFEAAYEKHFWQRGALTLRIIHQEMGDILDYKPIWAPSGAFDVRGNIGDGRTDQVSVDAAVPTDVVLFEGGLLSASGAWRDSAEKDPVTGVMRRISFDNLASYRFSYLQDFSDWNSTWSVSYNSGWNEIGYRLSEIDRSIGAPSVRVGWKYRPTRDINIDFVLSNPLIASRTRTSDYFSGPRSDGILQQRQIEVGYARPHAFLGIRKEFN
jgi:outer membrane receptor protein involved in Fe transport